MNRILRIPFRLDRKDKDKSKAKLTDNLSESTLKLTLVSPRSPRIAHPRDLSEEEKAELKEEIVRCPAPLPSSFSFPSHLLFSVILSMDNIIGLFDRSHVDDAGRGN